MERDLLAAFGRAVRLARIEIGISQEELAARSGLHRTYVGSVERGQRNVSLINIARIARALGVPPAGLFAGIDSNPTNLQGTA
jgi:transcriptional regulator with XRE-family HTH domain